MAVGEQQIRCRNCNETIPLDSDNCPHCGTSVRSLTAPIGVIVLGAIIAAASLLNIGDLWFYGAIGFAMVAVGGMLIYGRQSRIVTV